MHDTRVLELLWEKCEIGCATVSEDGRFTAVNDKLCEILEYAEVELVGMRFSEITAPSDITADLAMTRKVAAGEAEHYRMIKTYIKKSGFPVQIELVVWPVQDADGKFEFFLSQIIPRVDIQPSTPSTVALEPGIILFRMLGANKKVVLAILATVVAMAGVATALFEFLLTLLDKS